VPAAKLWVISTKLQGVVKTRVDEMLDTHFARNFEDSNTPEHLFRLADWKSIGIDEAGINAREGVMQGLFVKHTSNENGNFWISSGQCDGFG
jgi:hypothetical protein